MENRRQESRYKLPWAKHVQAVRVQSLQQTSEKGQVDSYRDAERRVKCIITKIFKERISHRPGCRSVQTGCWSCCVLEELSAGLESEGTT